MPFQRASGLLLHPTSLPGRYGIGDLGPAAATFLDWLELAGQRIWQVLPLGPTGYADSPYQCFSAFAGNPLLVSPELLLADGWLQAAELAAHTASLPASGAIDFSSLIPARWELLRLAYQRFLALGGAADYLEFCRDQAGWLDDFALFMAIKQQHGGVMWSEWPPELALREPQALERAREQLHAQFELQRFAQWQFFRQWQQLKQDAAQRGISIFGDLPIFVAYDSADVWANPELFRLDQQRLPTVVAGVPPDYFSATGQRWGNPLYRWDVMQQQGYQWWIARLRASLALLDIVRVDHFRGFVGYWEIPAFEPTAVNGQWVPGPGADLFEALYAALGELPIVAEDLGVITPDVVALREQFGLPGMRILQFAFSADTSPAFLPHNYERNSVAYTGTHDNNTTVGWFASCTPEQRARVLRYTGTDGHDIAWDLIRLVLGSVANTAIVPVQDLLSLDAGSRMNSPGTPAGNWTWRLEPLALDGPLAARLRALAEIYQRR